MAPVELPRGSLAIAVPHWRRLNQSSVGALTLQCQKVYLDCNLWCVCGYDQEFEGVPRSFDWGCKFVLCIWSIWDPANAAIHVSQGFIVLNLSNFQIF